MCNFQENQLEVSHVLNKIGIFSCYILKIGILSKKPMKLTQINHISIKYKLVYCVTRQK